MRQAAYQYVGKKVPGFEQETAFWKEMEKAVLHSLKERGLLTAEEKRLCEQKLEKRGAEDVCQPL